MSETWQTVLMRCVQLIVATACGVAVLLVTANNPSADEFAKGIPASLLSAISGFLTGMMLKK